MTAIDDRSAEGGTAENAPSERSAAPRGVAAWRRWMLWSRRNKITAFILAIAGLLAWIATVGSGVFDALGWQDSRRHAVPASPTIDSPIFDVPFCATIEGSAPTRDGKKLLIAIHYNDGRFFIQEPRRSGDRWSFRGEIASANGLGVRFTVVVFYLDSTLSDYLLKAEARAAADGRAAYVLYPALPPGTEDAVAKDFVRANTPGPGC